MAYADTIRSATAKMGDVATLIETALLNADQVHAAAAATSTTSTSWTLYRSNEVTLSVAAGQQVFCWAYLLSSHGSSSGKIQMTIQEDGVDTTYYGDETAWHADTNGQDHCVTFAYLFSPSAGSRTYSQKWQTTSGTVYSTRGGLIALALQAPT